MDKVQKPSSNEFWAVSRIHDVMRVCAAAYLRLRHLFNDWRIGKNLEGFNRGLVEVLSLQVSGGTEKTTKNFSQVTRFSGWDSNLAPSNESLQGTCSVKRKKGGDLE
jgi:hypothetical protein